MWPTAQHGIIFDQQCFFHHEIEQFSLAVVHLEPMSDRALSKQGRDYFLNASLS